MRRGWLEVTAPLIEKRKAWARALVARCKTTPPQYGTAEWFALPEGSPAKVAGVVIAAEAWTSDGDNLADNLERELDDRRRVDKMLEDAEYHAASSEHRRHWGNLRLVPDRGDLETRVAKARLPRPGDYRPSPRGDDLDVS